MFHPRVAPGQRSPQATCWQRLAHVYAGWRVYHWRKPPRARFCDGRGLQCPWHFRLRGYWALVGGIAAEPAPFQICAQPKPRSIHRNRLELGGRPPPGSTYLRDLLRRGLLTNPAGPRTEILGGSLIPAAYFTEQRSVSN